MATLTCLRSAPVYLHYWASCTGLIESTAENRMMNAWQLSQWNTIEAMRTGTLFEGDDKSENPG